MANSIHQNIEKPKVFIGSSIENSNIADSIHQNIEKDSDVESWKNDFFELSKPTIDSFEKIGKFDFGIFIFSPDDIGIIRNKKKQIVRDNVVFELGLFIGRLGKERTFIVAPEGLKNLHLPSDLLGITIATFDPKRLEENPSAALVSACNKIKFSMKKLGSKKMELPVKRELPVLSETINSINKKELELFFQQFEGYYFGYINWIIWEKNGKILEAKNSVYKFLVKIHAIDEEHNVIKTKLTTKNELKKVKTGEKWVYHGIMIPISRKLYFIFEERNVIRRDCVFIITHDKPEDHLRGVLIAESATPIKEVSESFPASSRIRLEKISEDDKNKGEDYLMSQMGYFQQDKIDENIREEINNKIEDRLGILMTYSLECKLHGG